MAYEKQDQEVWNKKDRADDWRSIWHSLVSGKDIPLENYKKYQKVADEIYAHLQIVREDNLDNLINKKRKEIKPF